MNNNLNSIPNNYMNESHPPPPPSSAYVSQGSQYNDVDWNKYETSILERNETGSFYIPSSGMQKCHCRFVIVFLTVASSNVTVSLSQTSVKSNVFRTFRVKFILTVI